MTKRPRISDVTRRLSPDEAADRVRDDPDNVLFSMDEALKATGLTRAEMLVELQSGRLRAVKVPDSQGRGYFVMITATQLLNWQAAQWMRKQLN